MKVIDYSDPRDKSKILKSTSNIDIGDSSESFLKLANDSFRCGMFLLLKLPSAFFAGVRVKEATDSSCQVTVPYWWFSTNPFKSTYFACLAMAAELSTGVMAMANIYRRNPSVSLLVVKVEANFHKKATSVTTFTCNNGIDFKLAIGRAVSTREAQIVVAKSVGLNKFNEEIATFFITWSFRVKNTSD